MTDPNAPNIDLDLDLPTKILNRLSLSEKCTLLSSHNMWETTPLPTHSISPLKTTDGPAGVRGAKWTNGSRTTFIPCGISLAATFDRDLVRRMAGVLGAEARQKQAHVLLAPTMNISRSPFGGRNFENFGEDPFLTGSMAREYIVGVQCQGVGACMKHFVGNDQETRRFNMDERIDERTLREIYLRPFEMALSADPWTAMVAYPKINGVHADCSEVLVKGILREEWGFQGLVMSDWGGLNDTVLSIKATTDLEMPGPAFRYGKALEEAVRDGRVSEEEDINPSVLRVLKTLQRAGRLVAQPQKDRLANNEERAENIMDGEETVDHPEYRDTAREAAEGGIVLLKNKGTILPLQPKELKKLAILGPNAKTPTAGGSGSAIVNPYYVTNPHDSLVKTAQDMNPDLEIVYEQGIQTHLHLPLLGDILTTPDGCRQGVQVDFYHGHSFEGEVVATTYWQDSMVYLMSDGDIPNALKGKTFCKARFFVNDKLLIDNTEWTQICAHFMNCSSPDKTTTMHLNAGEQYTFRIDNVVVPPPTRPHDNTRFHRIAGVKVGMLIQHHEDAMFDKALQAAKDADVVVVVAGHNNDTEREGCDRVSLSLPRRTDEFIQAVAEANSNTVVVTQSACAIAMPWANEVSGIVHAWYQGQENGNALANVLLGTVNPSGKLPVTFPKRIEDHGSHKWFPGNPETDQAEYGEGVLVGYRWLDAHNLEPLWPFGFGLSYTSFEISDVKVHGNIAIDKSRTARIFATVTNTGSVPGKEVVQVYVSSSSAVPEDQKVAKGLAGFAKIEIHPGASERVEITLDPSSFAWYDVGSPGWRIDPGKYQVFVGNSSRNISTSETVTVE
ncbi:glycoside hydrolase [Aspergillus stella-maris]|uniref:glycoside hydrolase n=1 Tax=Aspergillus stella-maris TaxID=1810926 RepID=UPI003CCE3C9D